ncbi:hypothetical protein L581_2439 [Serratia fonticola AU-AP2C]|nr:hypothetical protein L581_2439 [Serratia fonticola AU-AP2C]
MTDKTPKNTAETAVNTSAALAKTTDTAREGELKSRALPQADALKDRFKAGSIPLQTDFADLIDLANMGRQAVGGAEGQIGPADGFTLSSEGRLELKPNAAKGISVDQDGVAIKLKTISGLTMDKDGVSVKPKADSGIELKDSTGISIKPGNGIAVNSSGVNVKLAKGINTNGGEGQGTDGTTSGSAGGLNVNQNGFSVDPGDGMQINTRGVSIKLAANSGLSADEKNGLKIVPEQMFQKGMIMMFSGTKAETPQGWALCDGGPGTPDLRDRFIVMAGTKFTGKGDGTTYTGSTTVTGTVNVAETKLTTAQIPSHSHNVELNSFYYVAKATGSGVVGSSLNVHRDGIDWNGTKKTSKTEMAGSDQAHKHTATMTTTPHTHTISAIPPYYALAFIIKL